MNQNQMDKALYGKVLEGKGPWPEGPKTIEFKKLRRKMHAIQFGDICPYKSCPICKPVRFII